MCFTLSAEAALGILHSALCGMPSRRLVPARQKKPPLPRWGAKLSRKLRRRGYSRVDVAAILGYSQWTVRKVDRYYKKHGTDREPRQGKGKRDDVRWVFAGRRKERNLAALRRAKEAGDAADLKSEIHVAFMNHGAWGSPAYRTLCNALATHLNQTRKRVCAHPLTRPTRSPNPSPCRASEKAHSPPLSRRATAVRPLRRRASLASRSDRAQLAAIARERDVGRSLQWRVHMRIQYEPYHFLLFDESASNSRTLVRNVGYSERGTIAKTNKYFFHKGVNHSVLGPFALDGGFLDLSIVEGAYDADTFWMAFNQVGV